MFDGVIAHSMHYPDTEPLRGAELKEAVAAIEAGTPISPTTGERMFATDLHEDKSESGIRKFQGVVALLGANVAVQTTLDMKGDALPELSTLPAWLHQALSNIYGLYPFGRDEVASAALRDHIPELLLGAAILGSFDALRTSIRTRRFQTRARAAQHEFAERVASGTQPWQIEPGSTVAFVGNGDPLAHRLAQQHPHEIIQIAHKRIEGPWTYLPADGLRSDTERALRLADIANAGEILFLPTKTSQEFLPGPTDHDISIDRMISYIDTADDLCRKMGVPPRPVIIVGDKEQAEWYGKATDSSKRSLTKTGSTLEQRLDGKAEKRGCDITIIDPTDVVIDVICRIADGRNIEFQGTGHSVETYKDKFFRSLIGLTNPDANLPPISVIYNNNDLPTAGWDYDGIEQDVIPIILDPSQREPLIRKGIPEDRIIVVSDTVIQATADLFKK